MDFTHDEHCTCPGCLTWAPYDTMYVDFAMEYSQQMLTYTLAREAFRDFPKNLPPHIIVPIIAKRWRVLDNEIRRRGIPIESPSLEDMDDPELIAAAEGEMTKEQHRIRCAFEGVYALARFGKKIPEMEFPAFERVLISQNIIAICSFAEGFIQKTIRVLSDHRPAAFQAWERAKASELAGSNPSERLEKYLFRLGMGSIEKKLDKMGTEFGVSLPISPAQRKTVGELFLLRNCIVHNAGRVSTQFKNSGAVAAHVQVGDEVELRDEQIEGMLDVLVDVLTVVYRTVAVQVLNKPADRLMFGPHRADTIPQ
ncbi:MAG: hypothetical protein WED34_09495 [Planctomycetales bacterium]